MTINLNRDELALLIWLLINRIKTANEERDAWRKEKNTDTDIFAEEIHLCAQLLARLTSAARTENRG